MLRRPIVIIGVILVVILFGVLIFRIDWGGKKGPVEQRKEEKSFPDYANSDTKVRFTNNGAINSNEDHREIQITVGRDNVDIKIVAGYQGNVIKSQQFGNNPDAYKSFLSALDIIGFTKTKVAPIGSSEEGSCPQGQRLVFDVFDTSETISHSWSTSCSSKTGTFGGNVSQTRSLFQAQVPDYNEFVSGVSL